MQTFSGLPNYDIWYMGCIIYHPLFGSPLCNVDIKQNNSLMSVCIYHCSHLFAMFVFLLLSYLGVLQHYEDIKK